MVYTFTTENFEAEVLNSDVPVFVDFYADWCGPCKMMSPVIDKLADEFDGKIKVGKINVDDNAEVAMKYNIMSIPNMKFFKGGQVVDEVIGAIPKAAMKAKFEQNI
jgi:thioredoxin 1